MTTTALQTASKTALPGTIPLVPTPAAGDTAGLFNGLLAGLLTGEGPPQALGQPGPVPAGTPVKAAPAAGEAVPLPTATDESGGTPLPAGLVSRAAMPGLIQADTEALPTAMAEPAAPGTGVVADKVAVALPGKVAAEPKPTVAIGGSKAPLPVMVDSEGGEVVADAATPELPADIIGPATGASQAATPAEETPADHGPEPVVADATAKPDPLVQTLPGQPSLPTPLTAAKGVAQAGGMPEGSETKKAPEDPAPAGMAPMAQSPERSPTPAKPAADMPRPAQPAKSAAATDIPTAKGSANSEATPTAGQAAGSGAISTAAPDRAGDTAATAVTVVNATQPFSGTLVDAIPMAAQPAVGTGGEEIAGVVDAGTDTAAMSTVLAAPTQTASAQAGASPTRPIPQTNPGAKPLAGKPSGTADMAATPGDAGSGLAIEPDGAAEETGVAERAARIEEAKQAAGKRQPEGEDGAANLAGASANPAQPAQAPAKPTAPQAAPGTLTAAAVAAPSAGAEANLDAGTEQPSDRSLADPGSDPALRPALGSEAPRAGTTEFAQHLAAARQTRGGPNPPALNQVAVHVQRAVQDGNDRLSIQLRPTDLGRVDVQIEFGGDGRMKAKIMAENPYTLDLLQKDSRALERALQDVGLRPEAGGLSFSLRDQGQQAQREDQGRRDKGFGMRVGADARADEVQAPPAYMPVIGPGRVDVRI